MGEAKTAERLYSLIGDDAAVQSTLDYFKFAGSIDETLDYLSKLDSGNEFATGVEELKEVISYLQVIGVPEKFYSIDFKIARGLDYYTGTVYETKLLSNPEIGSICSGGRYDYLLQKLGAKSHMPGVGISISSTRLLYSLTSKGLITPNKFQNLILVTTMDPNYIKQYLAIASELRQNNIPAFLYTEQQKLTKQLKYAVKRGIRYVLIAGENEFAANTVLIRDITTGEQYEKSKSTLVESLTALITKHY